MEIDVELHGIEDVMSGFDALTIKEEEIIEICTKAASILEKRAKEILTENKHIVTGALRRSIQTIVERMVSDVILMKVGSFLDYAEYVENLPDGGYLYPAFLETKDEVLEYIVEELAKRGIR